jgi:hypothetical protein
MLRPLAMALVHHPVLDRRGDVVKSAITNLDIHDIARVATTYGISRYYLVTPAREQQQLIGRIVAHWREGFGAEYNQDRCLALDLIKTVDSLDDAFADWRSQVGPEALPLLTGARHRQGIGYRSARVLAGRVPLLLVFGTGHGLAPELYQHDWPMLAPIRGGGYNHLSVRAAAAIILDRLVGEQGRVMSIEQEGACNR